MDEGKSGSGPHPPAQTAKSFLLTVEEEEEEERREREERGRKRRKEEEGGGGAEGGGRGRGGGKAPDPAESSTLPLTQVLPKPPQPLWRKGLQAPL